MILELDNYLTTLKETSYDKENRKYMVDYEILVIDFDEFQEEFFKKFKRKVCCSVDALVKIGEEWYFIEFKNGKIQSREKRNISEKIGFSILTFLKNMDESIGYCANNINFVLVYNEEKNSRTNHPTNLSRDEIQFSKERNNLKGRMPGVKRTIPLFQLGKYEVYLKRVYTYSVNEFHEFVKEKMHSSV